MSSTTPVIDFVVEKNTPPVKNRNFITFNETKTLKLFFLQINCFLLIWRCPNSQIDQIILEALRANYDTKQHF